MAKLKHVIVDDNGTWKEKFVRGFTPPNYIGEMLEGEDVRWLQLENIDDGQGNLIPTITVNAPLKASIQAQDLQDELDEEAQKAAEKALKDAKKLLLKNFKKTDITDLNSIKNVLFNIIDYLKDLDPTIDEA